ncbi:MAG TPA: metalloregulator ArsR/SmtB family transcription factor [Candidatus Dormibacteraeota bacterium]|nr:metalloregulator ArsR/SmtB family transcription factor [Candidatus Dormibacteraeota bacterium]
MGQEETISGLARVLAHETCIRLVDALARGEATVSDLACQLGLDQPRVSTHLSLMRDAGLVVSETAGRQRVYSLRGRAPELALTALRTLAASVGDAAGQGQDGASRVRRRPAGDDPLRRARTCYDHLAGAAGVQLLDDLLARGWLAPRLEGERDLRVTDRGGEALAELGIDLTRVRRSRRAFAIECLDWTERRPHLGGALGAALLVAMLDQGRVRLRPAGRAVELQPGEPAAFLDEAAPRA